MFVDNYARILQVRDAVVDMINADAASSAASVTSATNASPIVITSSIEHGLADKQDVTVSGVLGNTAANGTFSIVVVDGIRFSLTGTTGNGTYTSGGSWFNTRFTAKASYMPWYRLANLKVIQLDVRVVSDESTVIDRATPPGTEDYYHLEITLQKECNAYDTDRLDELMSIIRRIAKLFIPNTQIAELDGPEVMVTDIDHDDYDWTTLDNYGVFYSKIELTLREYANNTP